MDCQMVNYIYIFFTKFLGFNIKSSISSTNYDLEDGLDLIF